jgi:nicotinamide riboside kinase
MMDRGWTREDLKQQKVQLELQQRILERQIHDYTEITGPTLLDRGILDTLAYAHVYLGEASEIENMKLMVSRTQHTKDSIFFHVLPQKELLSDDGFRNVPEQEEQVRYDHYLKHLFLELNALVFEIKEKDMLARCLLVVQKLVDTAA